LRNFLMPAGPRHPTLRAIHPDKVHTAVVAQLPYACRPTASHAPSYSSRQSSHCSFCATSLCMQAHSIPRSELFIQTKFTPIAGQDRSQPLPYDPAAPLPEQVCVGI